MKFAKENLNLENALDKEWIITNGMGQVLWALKKTYSFLRGWRSLQSARDIWTGS